MLDRPENNRPLKSGSSKKAALFPVDIDGLCFEASNQCLINQISCRIEAPGISVILGANGAGKSLFLRLLHGLIEPSSGTIKWHGQRPDRSIYRAQAMVFQKPVLLRRSTAANIHFVLKSTISDRQSRAEKVAAALKRANLADRAQTPARLLSGGEQQRLALARALALEPSLLLLDEPAAFLDPAASLKVEKMISGADESGVKIILVTHDTAQAKRLADEVIFLHQGRLLEQRESRKFFKNPKCAAAKAYLEGRLYV